MRAGARRSATVAIVVVLAGCGSGKRSEEEDAGADSDADTDTGTGSDTDTGTSTCDADGDNHLAFECYGDDCDDANWDVHPGVDEDEGWTVDWIFAELESAYAADFALDASDVAHVAFTVEAGAGGAHFNELRYATDAGSDWSFETIEPGEYSGEVSVTTDGEGIVHVVYSHAPELGAPAELRHAVQGGGWTVETVDSLENAIVAFRAPVVVADDGVVHVTYSSGPLGSRVLRHAESGPDGRGPFTPEDVDDSADAAWSSLAITPDGALHVLYYSFETPGLYHATNAGGPWRTELVDDDDGAGWDSSVRVDEAGALHVVYRNDAYDYLESEIRHATDATGIWEIEPVAVAYASGVDSTIDPSGTMHVAWRDLVERRVGYATNASGEWATETVLDRPGDNNAMAIAVGTDARIRVLFLLSDENDVGWAHTEPGNGIDEDCNGIAR